MFKPHCWKFKAHSINWEVWPENGVNTWIGHSKEHTFGRCQEEGCWWPVTLSLTVYRKRVQAVHPDRILAVEEPALSGKLAYQYLMYAIKCNGRNNTNFDGSDRKMSDSGLYRSLLIKKKISMVIYCSILYAFVSVFIHWICLLWPLRTI